MVAIGMYVFMVVSYFTLWKPEYTKRGKYTIQKQKDELIFLVGENLLSSEDDLFRNTYNILEVFEPICDKISFRHIFEALEKASKDGLRREDIMKTAHRLDSAPKEVQDAVRNSYMAIMGMVIQNSITLSVFFFLLRKTIVKVVFVNMPRFLINIFKKIFRTQSEAISEIVFVEKNIGLRLQ